jgi:hypothetical protein
MSNDIKQEQGLGVQSAVFQALDRPVWGATRICTLIGTWDSPVIDGTSNLLLWTSATYSGTVPSNSKVYFFQRTSDDPNNMGEWSVPSLNYSAPINTKARYVQTRMVLVSTGCQSGYGYQYGNNTPLIDFLTIKGITSANADKFFTKTFDLGFSPKHFIITSESEVPDGTILRFGVTNLDSVDEDDYVFIEENKVENLDLLSATGTKIKIMIEMSGSSSEEVVVHEFATMFSGEGNKQLNKSN